MQVHKNKRMINAKTNHQKLHPYDSKIAEGGHPMLCLQSSSSYLSEDDSNVFHESNAGVLPIPASCSDSKGAITAFNLNGKTRASRGSATDHQSLYARVRTSIPAIQPILCCIRNCFASICKLIWNIVLKDLLCLFSRKEEKK